MIKPKEYLLLNALHPAYLNKIYEDKYQFDVYLPNVYYDAASRLYDDINSGDIYTKLNSSKDDTYAKPLARKQFHPIPGTSIGKTIDPVQYDKEPEVIVKEVVVEKIVNKIPKEKTKKEIHSYLIKMDLINLCAGIFMALFAIDIGCMVISLASKIVTDHYLFPTIWLILLGIVFLAIPMYMATLAGKLEKSYIG